MAYIQTSPVDFTTIPVNKYPVVGDYIMGIDIVDNLYKKMDYTGVTTLIGGTNLSGMTDVSISNPSNGQVLKYSNGVWTNGTDVSGSTTLWTLSNGRISNFTSPAVNSFAVTESSGLYDILYVSTTGFSFNNLNNTALLYHDGTSFGAKNNTGTSILYITGDSFGAKTKNGNDLFYCNGASSSVGAKNSVGSLLFYLDGTANSTFGFKNSGGTDILIYNSTNFDIRSPSGVYRFDISASSFFIRSTNSVDLMMHNGTQFVVKNSSGSDMFLHNDSYFKVNGVKGFDFSTGSTSILYHDGLSFGFKNSAGTDLMYYNTPYSSFGFKLNGLDLMYYNGASNDFGFKNLIGANLLYHEGYAFGFHDQDNVSIAAFSGRSYSIISSTDCTITGNISSVYNNMILGSYNSDIAGGSLYQNMIQSSNSSDITGDNIYQSLIFGGETNLISTSSKILYQSMMLIGSSNQIVIDGIDPLETSGELLLIGGSSNKIQGSNQRSSIIQSSDSNIHTYNTGSVGSLIIGGDQNDINIYAGIKVSINVSNSTIGVATQYDLYFDANSVWSYLSDGSETASDLAALIYNALGTYGFSSNLDYGGGHNNNDSTKVNVYKLPYQGFNGSNFDYELLITNNGMLSTNNTIFGGYDNNMYLFDSHKNQILFGENNYISAVTLINISNSSITASNGIFLTNNTVMSSYASYIKVGYYNGTGGAKNLISYSNQSYIYGEYLTYNNIMNSESSYMKLKDSHYNTMFATNSSYFGMQNGTGFTYGFTKNMIIGAQSSYISGNNSHRNAIIMGESNTIGDNYSNDVLTDRQNIGNIIVGGTQNKVYGGINNGTDGYKFNGIFMGMSNSIGYDNTLAKLISSVIIGGQSNYMTASGNSSGADSTSNAIISSTSSHMRFRSSDFNVILGGVGNAIESVNYMTDDGGGSEVLASSIISSENSIVKTGRLDNSSSNSNGVLNSNNVTIEGLACDDNSIISSANNSDIKLQAGHMNAIIAGDDSHIGIKLGTGYTISMTGNIITGSYSSYIKGNGLHRNGIYSGERNVIGILSDITTSINATNNVIVGGYNNYYSGINFHKNAIIGGQDNHFGTSQISNILENSLILGGINNTIDNISGNTFNSAIISSENALMFNTSGSTIIGGYGNTLYNASGVTMLGTNSYYITDKYDTVITPKTIQMGSDITDSWRFRISGTDLLVEHYDGANWTQKGIFTP